MCGQPWASIALAGRAQQSNATESPEQTDSSLTVLPTEKASLEIRYVDQRQKTN